MFLVFWTGSSHQMKRLQQLRDRGGTQRLWTSSAMSLEQALVLPQFTMGPHSGRGVFLFGRKSRTDLVIIKQRRLVTLKITHHLLHYTIMGWKRKQLPVSMRAPQGGQVLGSSFDENSQQFALFFVITLLDIVILLPLFYNLIRTTNTTTAYHSNKW